MAKLFISQPMVDKTNEEIRETREQAVADIQEIFKKKVENENINGLNSIEIINNSFFEDSLHNDKPLWFLGKSLQLLADSDMVYFAEGWENSRGCKIEHEAAVQYEMNIIKD